MNDSAGVPRQRRSRHSGRVRPRGDRQPRDVAASVRQRLLNLARTRREDFQGILTRFALERLLYQLSRWAHRD